MVGPVDDARVLLEAQAMADAARDRLRAGGARTEAHARYVAPRRVLLIQRSATMESLGRVWRLGVLLLDEDARLHATGSLTRAVPTGHPNFQSLSAESRRELRQAALKAGFDEGETVNLDTRPIEWEPDALRASAGPLVLTDDGLGVRWAATAVALVPFASYLTERVDLLLHPPQGA